MKNIEEFTKNFTDKKFEYLRIRNSYFLLSEDLKKAANTINQEPFAAGIFLGEISKNNFVPGVSLLGMISPLTDKKIFINKKTEWLFLCQRDIFGGGIVKANVKKGFVLVQNELDENLGYGQIVADLGNADKVVVKNLFDKGNFLRRERR